MNKFFLNKQNNKLTYENGFDKYIFYKNKLNDDEFNKLSFLLFNMITGDENALVSGINEIGIGKVNNDEYFYEINCTSTNDRCFGSILFNDNIIGLSYVFIGKRRECLNFEYKFEDIEPNEKLTTLINLNSKKIVNCFVTDTDFKLGSSNFEELKTKRFKGLFRI